MKRFFVKSDPNAKTIFFIFENLPQNNTSVCHPERAILLRVERGARHEVSGSRMKFCYPLVDPVLRTPLRGSTPLRSAQDDTREYIRAHNVR